MTQAWVTLWVRGPSDATEMFRLPVTKEVAKTWGASIGEEVEIAITTESP
jgi:hypothetical protein